MSSPSLSASPPATSGSGAEWEADGGRTFVVGSALLLALAAALPALVAASGNLTVERISDLQRLCDTAAALLAAAAVCLVVVFRRLVDRRPTPAFAVATLMTGLSAAANPGVLGVVLPDRAWVEPVLPALAQASAVAALGLFATGLLRPGWHARIRPRRLTGLAGGAVVALAVAFRLLPGLGDALSVSVTVDGDGREAGAVVADLIVASVWLVLAVAYVRRTRTRTLPIWTSVLVSGLAASQLAMVAAESGTNGSWLAVAAGLRATALLVAVVGCGLEVLRSLDEDRALLRDAELDVELAEVRNQIRAGTERTQRHDVANTLTTIQVAAAVLERDFETLAGADRALLREVLTSGTLRLRNTLQPEAAIGAVSLGDAAHRLTTERSLRSPVEVDVPADLASATLSPETVEALRQVLEFASRRTSVAPVTLRGDREEDGRVVVLVEDRGELLVGSSHRQPIEHFDGRRGPSAWRATLGLMVAARLVRAQGGQVWVEPRPDGGACFGICLPANATDGEDDDALG